MMETSTFRRGKVLHLTPSLYFVFESETFPIINKYEYTY